ncbi:MAG TPA: hypothetical protein DEF43_11925 [Chloroflexus aurantiacus]|jgi:polyphosphate kinase 2 (PPK2 family)|uniref:Polyphosphate kinase-2-related domain-containing protein n=1 Tax=Chloroflexus aurantiacus (strain ATCC 29366 / DSM 635 / J-10-fl) TaxID=324602 RepID=A9WCL1_CHLAA|nr:MULTISPECIES: hypothetical protein [Chloroflexus]ABY36973.1 protein of unknown function DUF344 [Chloroflexus aurantiacus J-10-fl]RMG47715.1 MAG: hypothetical protein D6716_14930 [Chloroflexota bacterium]GIV93261.1 MAG: hypothetical protein KatS3mg056_1970 [Chloroflexus sp.]HBW67844.1 hypothetical protein [Chloroflexus aurantiacus]
MLERCITDVKLSKEEYTQLAPGLQARLFDLEQMLLEARIPTIFVFEGWAGTAKARTIATLTRRLDPRGFRVHSITPPRTYEQQYPWLYRFWLKIPSYGQMSFFDRSWYRELLAAYTTGGSRDEWRTHCEDAVIFERQLADDGALILKFWLHITKKQQARRFAKLLADPLNAWRVTEEDLWQHRHYKKVYLAVEEMLSRTDTAFAPWHIIPAADKRYARLTVLQIIVGALESRLGITASDREASLDDSGLALRRYYLDLRTPVVATPRAAPVDAGNSSTMTLQQAEPITTPVVVTPVAPLLRAASPLQRVDLSLRLDDDTYHRELKRLQARMYLLGLQVYHQKRPVVFVFEGWDAAGKGGAIQRLTAELDPRAYTVHAIAAPAGDDKARHYLYRFWRRLPPRGQFAIFDRSWYGRVLVERVEGFARPDEWRRAYAEINQFERQLVDFGAIIAKFWLHISPEEQLRRFEERQHVPYKAWKLTDEDWRNREKWPAYLEAADEMLLRTSTPYAPWTIVEAEDKKYARIKILRTAVEVLEAELGPVKLD